MAELTTGMPHDAPTTTVSTTTTATAEQLWPLLSDPSTPVPFSDEFEGADWKPTEGVEDGQLGSRFVGRNSTDTREWTTLSTVTVHEEPRRFGWTVQKLDDPVSDWLFEVVDTDGGRELRLRCRLGPSELSGVNQASAKHPDRAEEFNTKRLASLAISMQRTVEGIAALAEQGS